MKPNRKVKPPVPIIQWAVIVRNPRVEWINPFTIRPQRQDARRAYLEMWIDRATGERHFKAKEVRLAKVRVEEV